MKGNGDLKKTDEKNLKEINELLNKKKILNKWKKDIQGR